MQPWQLEQVNREKEDFTFYFFKNITVGSNHVPFSSVYVFLKSVSSHCSVRPLTTEILPALLRAVLQHFGNNVWSVVDIPLKPEDPRSHAAHFNSANSY